MKNKQCYKLTKEQKKDILLSYTLDNSKENIKALCDKYNITRQTIWNISKDNKIKNDISIIDNTQNFTKRANAIMQQILDRLEEQIKKDDKATIAQLTTALGILYDKSRLENNLSTSNNSININIKIE